MMSGEDQARSGRVGANSIVPDALRYIFKL